MPWIMHAAAREGDFEQCPTGPHAAVLVRIVDLGTHLESSPQYGEKERRTVVYTWELAEKMSDGRPYSLSGWYTLSLHEKAKLRHMLESWRGRAFDDSDTVDITAALGKPCMLTVVSDAAGKSRVGSVSSLPRGMQAPQPHAQPTVFHLDEWNQATFDGLPDWMKERINSSHEMRGRQGGAPPPAPQPTVRAPVPTPPFQTEPITDTGSDGVPASDFDDDIPF